MNKTVHLLTNSMGVYLLFSTFR